MKNVCVYIFGVCVACSILTGCASADKSAQTVVDGTYQSLKDADEWIRRNMW